MIEFLETSLTDVWLLKLKKKSDDRGYFVRTFDQTLLEEQGLVSEYPQHSVSFNALKGTLRGLHYQTQPFAETKIVRCETGSIFDVVVDIRPDSATFKKYWSVELTADNDVELYIPAGCAHGFLTLSDNTRVMYYISQPYTPSHAAGIRWNDPQLRIPWPIPVTVISERDQSYPDFAV